MTAEPDYGVLTDVVAIAGSLIAAATAIRLAWMRRARWMPPEETVDGAVAKVTGVICAVLIGLLFLLRHQISLMLMATIAIGCLVLTIVTLIMSIYVNTKYSYTRTTNDSRTTTRETRFLGGSMLTQEAASKRRKENPPSVQQLFDYSHNRPEPCVDARIDRLRADPEYDWLHRPTGFSFNCAGGDSYRI
jgi:hypothetical protein